MIFLRYDRYGTLVDSDISETISKNSLRANSLFFTFNDLTTSLITTIQNYICRVSFSRNDETIPDVTATAATYDYEGTTYYGYLLIIANKMITEVAGELKVTARLIDSTNDVQVVAVNQILSVADNSTTSTTTSSISVAQYDQLTQAIQNLNQPIEIIPYPATEDKEVVFEYINTNNKTGICITNDGSKFYEKLKNSTGYLEFGNEGLKIYSYNGTQLLQVSQSGINFSEFMILHISNAKVNNLEITSTLDATEADVTIATGTQDNNPVTLAQLNALKEDVNDNTDDITALDGRVTTNETAIGNRYTKTEVNQLLFDKQGTLTAGGGISISEDGTISATTGFHVVKVTELPATGDSQVIYLKHYTNDIDPTDQDSYEEYVYIDGEWELLGKVKIDLSNYPSYDVLDDYIEEYVGAADMIIYEQVPAGTTTQKFRMLTIDGDKWEIDSYSRSEIDDRVQAIDDKIDEIDEKMQDLGELEERLNGYYTNLTNGESEEF